MKNFTFFIIILNLRFLPASGQDNIPRIPPSPDAASLGKFGEIPVSLYNGLPDISVPVYEIKSRDISVPITLRYHAGGIRVQEEAGWVGLGWALNAGGEITRMVNGNDDFLYSPNENYRGYIYSFDPRIALDATSYEVNTYMHQVCARQMDTEPDIFYFNFQGHSGKFYLQQKRYPGDPVVVRMLSPEKMDFDYNESTGTWTIWTIDGYKYVFGEKEYTENWSGSGPSEEAALSAISPPSPYLSCDKKFISTWLLTEITSPLGESVRFRYKHFDSQNHEFVTKSIPAVSETREESVGIGKLASKDGCIVDSPFENYGIIPMQPGYNGAIDFNCLFNNVSGYLFLYHDLIGTESFSQGYELTRYFSAGMPVYYQAYPDRIEFRDGTLRFFTSAREDLEEMNNDGRNPLTGFARPQALSKIELRNTKNERVRSFDFSYTYFNNANNTDPFHYKRLKLISFSSHNKNLEIPPYRFEYYEEYDLPSKNSRSRDHWGFFNDASNDNADPAGKPALIPAISAITDNGNKIIIKGADREPNGEFTRTGTLKKVIYPTGGSSEFIFENHSFNITSEYSSLPFQLIQVSTVNENRVIDIKQLTEIQFTVNLRCKSMACYQGGIQQPCDPPLENEPYFTLVNLSDRHEVLKEIYADYDCIFNPGSQWEKDKNINLTGNGDIPCGIERQISLTIKPGRYLLKLNSVNDIEVRISASYNIPQQAITGVNNSIVRGGGLRIKSIILHDGLDRRNDIVRKYQYEFPGNDGLIYSAGRLMSFPKYAYGEYYIAQELDESEDLVLKLRSASASNLPLSGSAQSGMVGYDRVEEIHGKWGTGGYVRYEYINRPDDEPYPYFPNTPGNSYAFKNGLLRKQTIFSKNHFIEKEISNEYDHKSIGQVIGTRLLNYSCGSNGMFLNGNYDYIYQQYRLPSEWWFKISSEEKTYDLEDRSNRQYLSSITNFNYNPDLKLISKTVTTDNRGREHIDRFYYPSDLTSIAPAQMWDARNAGYRHLNDRLIRQTKYVKENGIQTRIFETTNYYRFDNTIGKVILDHIDVAPGGKSPETRYKFKRYGFDGNLLEYSETGGSDIPGRPVTLLWGYSGSRLIARIDNATYNEVVSAANSSGTDISGILKTLNPEDLQNKLNLLRKNLPGAVMTSFSYDPLIGVNSVADLNGRSTFYEYDDLQRLKVIKDFELNPLTEYQYGYQNITSGF